MKVITPGKQASILVKLRDFNVICWLFGHKWKELRPLYSLRKFKETRQSIKVGSICQCKSCGRQANLLG